MYKKLEVIILITTIILFLGCKNQNDDSESVDTTVPVGTWVASGDTSTTVVLKNNGDWVMIETGSDTKQAKGTSSWKDGSGTMVQAYYRSSASGTWESYSHTFNGTKNNDIILAHNLSFIKTSSGNALPTVTGLQVSKNGSALTLTWTACSYASRYRVYYGKYMSQGSQSTDSTTGTSFTKSGFSSGVKIYFEVQAIIDDDWESGLSECVDATPSY